MQKSSRASCRLFVDESGKFEQPLDTVAVAGLLSNRLMPDETIKSGLRTVLPGMPWPLHAAHYRLPVTVALASAAARSSDPTSLRTPVDDAADRVLERLRSLDAERVERLLASFSSGILPEWADVRDLTWLFEREARSGGIAASDAEELKDAASRVAEAVRLMLECLDRQGSVCGVAAGEATQGMAGARSYAGQTSSSSVVPPTETARYLSLLAGVLGAASRVERLTGAGRDIQPIVLTRGVHECRGLEGADVDRAAPPGQGGPKFTPASVSAYDRRVSPRHVLSDFLANCARREMRSGGPAGIEDRLRTVTGTRFATVRRDGEADSHVVWV